MIPTIWQMAAITSGRAECGIHVQIFYKLLHQILTEKVSTQDPCIFFMNTWPGSKGTEGSNGQRMHPEPALSKHIRKERIVDTPCRQYWEDGRGKGEKGLEGKLQLSWKQAAILCHKSWKDKKMSANPPLQHRRLIQSWEDGDHRQGKFPWTVLVCRSQLWPSDIACHDTPGWHGCMERAQLWNTTMVWISKSTSCDQPSFTCFFSHRWSPQRFLCPRRNSLLPLQSM